MRRVRGYYNILYCIVFQNQFRYRFFTLREFGNTDFVIFLKRLRMNYTVCIIIIIHDTSYLYTFHNLRAIEVWDDLYAFAQKPNAVDCGITAGTHNNIIYIALLLLLSPRSCARDIYGISRLADAIPINMTHYIIVFCCAVMISLAIHSCRAAIPTYIILCS